MDATVALLIIAMGIAMTLELIGRSRKVASTALEIQAADLLNTQLMMRPIESEGKSAGRSGRLSWQNRLDRRGGERPLALCRREAISTSITSSRLFRVSTLVICPAADGE